MKPLCKQQSSEGSKKMHLESGKRLVEVINCKTLAKFTVLSKARPRENLPKASDSEPKFARFQAFY